MPDSERANRFIWLLLAATGAALAIVGWARHLLY